MAQWFSWVSYPLIAYNLILLVAYRKLTRFLRKYPPLLIIDLVISVAILSIGAGWRSSYFVYTLTTIMVFAIFWARAGAYLSAGLLSAAGFIKDPSYGLPSIEAFEAFNVSSWDMRLGAALFYVSAGLILGYFSTLLKRLEILSVVRVEEASRIAAMKEKNRLALELHDGVKQMVSAMLLKLHPLVKEIRGVNERTADEIRWLWRAMNFLQCELDEVMDFLNSGVPTSQSHCNLVSIAQEEAKTCEVMTGFSWEIFSEEPEILISCEKRMPMRRFLDEALMNACKHSGKTEGLIELGRIKDSIRIVVSDRGKGFDPGKIDPGRNTGLRSLACRARELGATFSIETLPGRGCKVILHLPASDL